MRSLSVSILALAFAATPAFADPAAEVVTGVEYSEGDYFTGEEVEILTLNNLVRVRAGRLTVSASLPWHRIEAPGNVVGGGGGVLGLPILVDPTQPATRTVREGIGDLRLGAAYALPSIAGVELGLTGQVKLPTASAERGIGTGETDVSIGAEASRSFGGLTPFVSIAYTMPGEPAAYDLSNAFSARGGLGLQLGRGVRANVAYSHAESISAGLPDERMISTGINASLSRSLTLGVYGNAGLSENAPDVGAGVSLGIRIF